MNNQTMLSKEAFKQLPIFITSMSRWDGDTSSASLALAKELSKSNKVFYIDFPYTITDYCLHSNKATIVARKNALLYRRNFLRRIFSSDQLSAVTPPLVLPMYNLPNGWLFNAISHFNNRRIASLLKKIVRSQNIPHYLFLNSFNPSYFIQPNRCLQPVVSIYQSRDDIEETHRVSIAREKACAHAYDLVLGTSTNICKGIEARSGVEAKYFPNGGDAELFATAITKRYARPLELQNIHTPIIGYTGAVCQRIDYELLVKLAQANPDKTIVLVGPRRDGENTAIDLDRIANIVFTGAKPIDELPAYLQHFDCCIIPFRCNKLTAGIYPLKLNEYLAAGKAVVCTGFSEDVRQFHSQVYLCDDHASFLQCVQNAINNNSAEVQTSRWQYALKNSWANRVEAFWELAWLAYVKKINHQLYRQPAV